MKKLSSLLAVAALCLPLAAPMAFAAEGANSLTQRQQELWDKTHAKLKRIYAERGITPNPMTEEEINAIKVPLHCDTPIKRLPRWARPSAGPKKPATPDKIGQLPWDARLLLSFDRDLRLSNAPSPLFSFILEKDEAFTPYGVTDFFFMLDDRGGTTWYMVAHNLHSLLNPLGLLTDINNINYHDRALWHKAVQAFIKETGNLPAVLELSQLGGDEIPGLWLVKSVNDCSPVVHFDYDDMPEFYLNSACLLDYVAIHIDGVYENLPGDPPVLFLTSEEARAATDMLNPKLEQLNNGLDAIIMAFVDEE